MPGEQDNRNVSSARLAFQILNELPSVTAPYREVCDDDVGVKIPRPAISLPALGSFDGLETQRAKADNVQFTRVVVIVDDEYQRTRRNVARAAAVHRREPGKFPSVHTNRRSGRSSVKS